MSVLSSLLRGHTENHLCWKQESSESARVKAETALTYLFQLNFGEMHGSSSCYISCPSFFFPFFSYSQIISIITIIIWVSMGPRVVLFLGFSLVAFLHIITWVSATTRPLPPNVVSFAAQSPGTEAQSAPRETLKREEVWESAEYREMKKIGSRPPDCKSKCYGCSPCVAIEVPTTNGNVHFSLQYANYFPEGWKCKCGHSYYSP